MINYNYVGVDVSKNKLDCLWLKDPEKNKVKTKVFDNTPKGHQQLATWLLDNTKAKPEEIYIVLEATSIYHEVLSYYLHGADFLVNVVNPSRVRNFAKGLGTLQKTDKKDSAVLARFGHQNGIQLWKPEPDEIRKLKSMLARLEALESDLLREKNRLEKAEITQSSQVVLASLDKMIKELKAEKNRVEREINDHIDQFPHLKTDRRLMLTIKGIGPVVSRWMLSIIHSRSFKAGSSVAAFLGLVPRLRESGEQKGRSHLSKVGPAHIRAKLYMAAVVAIKHNPDIKAQYQRLLSNGKTKMQAIGAAMRKLVQICFGVVKHQKEYQPQLA
ncbi:IS110 family transposase [Endozoicomonas sp. SCSIO W0465]|uniref:IS110 family transposase n=1 Tax=Endozoicomonas sp. SCSIO W0465 TaxID=2918516 RepID=UPI0020759B46|nr:IS110 family transposase [Endozoicomonas sp. SCSIO W0465]USE39397.1 IS110 family transposase [Endozoicomonas sp. SCSIO W0465]